MDRLVELCLTGVAPDHLGQNCLQLLVDASSDEISNNRVFGPRLTALFFDVVIRNDRIRVARHHEGSSPEAVAPCMVRFCACYGFRCFACRDQKRRKGRLPPFVVARTNPAALRPDFVLASVYAKAPKQTFWKNELRHDAKRE
jgi:hypothetical protein